MRKYAIKARKIGTLTVLATCASALHAQGTWIWQPQCGNLRWAEICSGSDDSCSARYFNNWGLSRCGSPPSLPGPGSICIFPSGSNALLDNTVDILSIDIDSNASLRWGRGAPSIWLTLRNPSDNSLGTLTNAGLFRIAGTCGPSFRFSGMLVNNNLLIHESGCVEFNRSILQNNNTAEVRDGGWFGNTMADSFINTGRLNKTTAGEFRIALQTQQQNAIVDVRAGSLFWSGTSEVTVTEYNHHNVNWSVASGASLILGLSNRDTHTFSGTHNWSVAENGSAALGEGTHIFTGTHSGEIAGTLSQGYGTVRVGSEGATFNFTGTGYLWQNGILDGGSTGLTNAGVLRISAGIYGRVLEGVLVNTGTLVHATGTVGFSYATLRNSGAIQLSRGQWSNSSGTNAFVNTGTLTKETLNNFWIEVPMQQQNAQVAVLEGLLSIGGSSSHTHQDVVWSVASGATLQFPSGTHTIRGVNRGEIAGTLIQTGGTVRAATDGGTLNFTGTGFQCSGGALSGGSAGLANAGVLRIVGGASLAGLLLNSGVLVQEAGNTDFNGASLRNSGTVELRDGQWRNISGTNTIVNTGTLRKTTTTNFAIAINTTNSGLIEVQNGTLSVNNLTQTAGETRIHRGANLSVSNPLAMQGGKLTGAGQLNGALNNTAGTIAPGIDDPDQPDLNPLGILTINGNLTLGNNAVFEVELTGTDNSDPANPQYDRVLISGSNRTVQVNGTLRVKGRDGYAPATGDTFDILVRSGSSWNATGGFRRVEVDPDTLPCVQVEVRYLSDRVQLVVTRAPGGADINRDGCVDDADLLAVLFAFGQTGSNLAEDINCDEVVDDADLLAVLFAFGSGC